VVSRVSSTWSGHGSSKRLSLNASRRPLQTHFIAGLKLEHIPELSLALDRACEDHVQEIV